MNWCNILKAEFSSVAMAAYALLLSSRVWGCWDISREFLNSNREFRIKAVIR